MATRMTKASLDSITVSDSALPFAVVVVLSFLSGWFASIIPAWFVFGPMLYSQGIENGGPFVPGDRVRILAGKHRGTIARVYGTGQHETVRVELGEAEKEQYTDFFSAYELVREKADEQSGEPESPMTRDLRSSSFGGGPVTAVVWAARLVAESIGGNTCRSIYLSKA